MDNTLRMIGLAMKAGRLEAGEEPAGQCCREKRCRLLLTASDAAEGTLRRAEHFAAEGACLLAGLPFSKEELGGAVGRGVCAVMAVTDAGLAAAFARRMAEEDLRFAALAEELDSRAQRARARQKARQAQKRAAEKRTRKPWAAPPSPDKGRQTGKKTGPKGTGRHP